MNRIWEDKGSNYFLLFSKYAIAGLLRILMPSEDVKYLQQIRLIPSSCSHRVDMIPGGNHMQSYPYELL